MYWRPKAVWSYFSFFLRVCVCLCVCVCVCDAFPFLKGWQLATKKGRIKSGQKKIAWVCTRRWGTFADQGSVFIYKTVIFSRMRSTSRGFSLEERRRSHKEGKIEPAKWEFSLIEKSMGLLGHTLRRICVPTRKQPFESAALSASFSSLPA